MKTLYLYAKGGPLPLGPGERLPRFDDEFEYVSYTSEPIYPGDIVIVIESKSGDESKSIRKVVEIRHQLDFNIVLEVTDKGYKHYMKFQLLEDMREDKLNQLLDK